MELVPGAFVSYRLRTDGTFEIPFATPSIAEIYGLTPAELAADPRAIHDVIHLEDRERVAAVQAASARDLMPLRCEYRVVHPTRGELWIEQASGVMREPDGSLFWHGSVRELGESKRELVFERDRLACFAASVPGAFASFRQRVDGEFEFTYASASAEQLYGISVEEILRDAGAVLALVVAEDQPRVYATIEESARTMTPWQCQYRLQHHARGVVWIDGHSKPVREPDGAITWHGVLLDITARKQAEVEAERDRAKLRSSESTLRAVVGAVPDFLILLDRDRRIRYINHLLPGYAMEDVVGRDGMEFVVPSMRANVEEAYQSVLATGQSQTFETDVVSRDGSTRWMNTRIGPVIHDGVIVGLTMASSDLTERRDGEDKLRASEALLRSVLESVNDAIITIDAHGRVISCNPATSRLFGYSEDELVDANISLLMPAPDRAQHDRYLTMAADHDALVVGRGRELNGRRKDASEFPIEVSVARFRLGEAVHFTGVIRDITARKKLEEQFRQAHKMEAFGQLAGGVAHDFNNLLTVILGESEYMASTVQDASLSPSEISESLHEIHEAGQRAAGLTRQLLAFSRKTVLEPKFVDVNQIVRDTEKMLKRLIGEDILVSTVLAHHLEHVHVDPTQLSQVLMNLAVNSRDAMPAGGRFQILTEHVTLTSQRGDLPPGDYVKLVVRDNGIGMPPEVASRVFQPFFTTKAVGKGTGLGLAVVHGIVTQSGGAIEVSSEEGEGTTFEILLPVTRAPALRTEKGLASHGTETVLVVEDDEAIRRLAVRILSNKGFKVLTAEDGRAALALLGSTAETIDVVVTDVVMPNMDGRELGECIRTRFPNAKLLYVSGYTDDMLVRRGLMSEEVEFLPKPYTPISLTQALQRVLARA
jgi:two-component system cell cycle sensor histidine kinase/response regulator CckA